MALPPELLDTIADLVAARVVAALPDPSDDGWMTTAEAAAYLGLSRNALLKLTAARKAPFVQDTPGGKMYFKRSGLDAWRGMARR